ncbi:unnamed protein product [Coregonus sp. 'balchen']|nr:unnamed protein product [Coregonus sp. 'balchen']
MADPKGYRAIPRMGITNAIRFAWREKEMEPFGRETFGRTILMGVLKLAVKDVLCLQVNPLEGAYDVVLHTEPKHDEVMGRVKEIEMLDRCATMSGKPGEEQLQGGDCQHEEEVRAFLGRYMDNVSSARLLKDTLGFWNGRRSFLALLKEDPGGLGGYLHPPVLFSLGADRGPLFYARQPPFCRRCMKYGHNFASCGGRKCRVCGSGAHEAKDCDESKKCHGRGSSAHVWRDCMACHKSYAAAAGGEQVQDRGKEEEEEREFQTRAKGQREAQLQRRRSREKQREERRTGRGRPEKGRKERWDRGQRRRGEWERRCRIGRRRRERRTGRSQPRPQ